MRTWMLVLIAAAGLAAGCLSRRRVMVETPDAAAEFLPDHIKREVEQTLEKEHEKTLDPKVE